GRNKAESGEDRYADGDSTVKLGRVHPHNTAPPFTLMISPVMKLARSEAANRMGPAISSGVPARRSGITVLAIFWPALVSSTGLDMSVATQPGATQFTRILTRELGGETLGEADDAAFGRAVMGVQRFAALVRGRADGDNFAVLLL